MESPLIDLTDPLPWSGEREGLVIRSAREDPAGFGPLYEHYRDTVYRYVRSRAETTEEAEDLLQEVLLRALDAVPHYHPDKGPFVAWLLGIAHNASIDAAAPP